jgi:hypothetical protein
MLIRRFSSQFLRRKNACQTAFIFSCFLEVTALAIDKKKGDFTVQQRKKKSEIIEENHHQVNVPLDVGDEEKKALEQTGEDATSGW